MTGHAITATQRATLIGLGLNKIGRKSSLVDTPAVRDRLSGLGAQIVTEDRMTPAYLGTFLKSEIEKWAAPIKAAGVQVGTAYLCCDEATTSAIHRAALHSDAARHTALTTLFSGRPARGIVNRAMRELGPLNPAAPAFPTATAAIAPLRAHWEKQGSGDFSPLWSGQNASGCRSAPAADITRDLLKGF